MLCTLQFGMQQVKNTTFGVFSTLNTFYSEDVLAVKGGGSKYTPLNETITQTMTSIKIISAIHSIYRLCRMRTLSNNKCTASRHRISRL